MKKILESGKYNLGPDSEGYIPLLETIEGGHLEAFILLRNYGANVYIDVPILGTCLHFAVYHDAINIAEYLLNTTKFRSWTRKNLYHDTPLHTAVYMRRFDFIHLFNKYGVDFRSRNVYGQTPLILAASLGDDLIVKILYNMGYSAIDVGKDNRSTIDIMLGLGKAETLFKIGALLKHSDPIDIPGRKRRYSSGFQRLYGNV